jgi:hypothetical protein
MAAMTDLIVASTNDVTAAATLYASSQDAPVLPGSPQWSADLDAMERKGGES